MSPRKTVSAQSSTNNVPPASGSHVFARFDSGYFSPVILLTRSRTRTTLVLISLVFPTPQTSMEILLFSLPEGHASVLDSGYCSCVRRSGSLLFRLGAILVATAGVQMSALWSRSGHALIAEFRIFHVYGVPHTCHLDIISCPLESGSLRGTGRWINNFVFHELCVSGWREEYREFWFHWEMTSRKCWCRWINSVSVENTGDRLCWLRGLVITSPTRVLSAWDLHAWLSEIQFFSSGTRFYYLQRYCTRARVFMRLRQGLRCFYPWSWSPYAVCRVCPSRCSSRHVKTMPTSHRNSSIRKLDDETR